MFIYLFWLQQVLDAARGIFGWGMQDLVPRPGLEPQTPALGAWSLAAAAAAAVSFQLCPTLCDPIDGSPPGSPIPGILQARTLEWVAISFSNAWKWKVKVKALSVPDS